MLFDSPKNWSTVGSRSAAMKTLSSDFFHSFFLPFFFVRCFCLFVVVFCFRFGRRRSDIFQASSALIISTGICNASSFPFWWFGLTVFLGPRVLLWGRLLWIGDTFYATKDPQSSEDGAFHAVVIIKGCSMRRNHSGLRSCVKVEVDVLGSRP